MKAGDRLVTEAATATATLDKPDLTPLLAWQTGQAIFENTPLSEAVREMNRYSTAKLEVDDGRVAALRVSGAYRVGDNSAFAHSVASLLPIAVREESGRMVLVANEVGKSGD